MYKIAFFCIPAHGHTNPTLEVVRELTAAGCQVWYYSFAPFREKIEAAGAKFIACDSYVEQAAPDPEKAAQVGQDLAFSVRLLADTTLALDEMVCASLRQLRPDCVVGDSMAMWGRFAALKLGIPFISSTTTFAFNRYSSKIMKKGGSQLFALLKAMPSVKRDLRRLQAHGYPVKNLLSILQNDNDTDTIVYTSALFQPCADTFSDRYAFVGPSIRGGGQPPVRRAPGKLVYISMGTVNNRLPDFYKHCIEAFRARPVEVILSVGEGTDIAALGQIPENFTVQNFVDQMGVLQTADVFLSHCGMNSVNESLFYGVPLVLFPQTDEQGGVANRVAELGAGTFLKGDSPAAIRDTVNAVLDDPAYRENAEKIADSFRKAGGAPAAAAAILKRLQSQRQI